MPTRTARIAASLLITGLAAGVAGGAVTTAQESDPIRIGLEAPLTPHQCGHSAYENV